MSEKLDMIYYKSQENCSVQYFAVEVILVKRIIISNAA